MRSRTLTFGLAAAALAVASCSSDTASSIETDLRTAATEVVEAADASAEDAAEAVARNIATQQGEEQFVDAGHELDGPLTCEASVGVDLSTIDINCTGTTQDGKAAALTGTTNELPGASVVSLDGEFSGTVDGAEVFNTTSLGG